MPAGEHGSAPKPNTAMRHTIDLPDKLEKDLQALTSSRGEDAQTYLLAAVTAAIARDTSPTVPKPTGQTLLDKYADILGGIHGGGTAWSEIEAACGPD